MDQTDSQVVGFDLDLTKVKSDSSKDPWLTPFVKITRHIFKA